MNAPRVGAQPASTHDSANRHEDAPAASALLAILARLDGRFDDPHLANYGPLGSVLEDIAHIAKTGLGAHNTLGGIRYVRSFAEKFLVTWAIDSDADSAREAAEEAWAAMRRPDSIANVFDVIDSNGEVVKVDLSEEPEMGPRP